MNGRRSPTPRRRRSAARASSSRSPTTTAAARVRARRQPLHRARRRRRRGRPGPGHAAGGNGQSLDTLLGKILRIDPTPTASEPRTRCPPTTRSSGHARRPPGDLGVRAAQPVAVLVRHATTGDLWIGDVGQNEWEEIDWCARRTAVTRARASTSAGTGSRARTTSDGNAPADAVRAGVRVLARRRRCSVTGGFVYRGTRSPTSRHLPVRRLLRRHAFGASTPDGDGVRRASTPVSRRRRCRASARTTTASSTCCP